MFAKLEIAVSPNLAGCLPVFRVFDDNGCDLGLFEAYDANDAIELAGGV